MNISPQVHEEIENQILYYFVHYADGCTVRFPYSEYGRKDALKFVGLKYIMDEAEHK